MPLTDPTDPDQFMAQRQQQQAAPLDPDAFMAGRGSHATVSTSRGGRNPGGGQTDPGASQLKGNALTDVLGGIADTTVRTIPAAARMAGHAVKAAMNPNPLSQDRADFNEDLGNMVNAQVDQGKKAKDAWKRGEHVEAFGHGLAAVTPVVGPAAANAGETIGGELEYDDPQHPERATGMVREPQVARGVGQGIGLTGSVVAPGVARGIAESKPAVALANKGAEILQTSAEKQYGRVLGATTKPNKVRSGDVIQGYDSPVASAPGTTTRVPGLLERGTTALTRKGLAEKANATVQDLGQQLETEWNKIPSDTGRPPAEVYAKIESQLQKQFMAPDPNGTLKLTGPDAQTGYEFGQSLKEYLRGHETVDAAGNPIIPYASIRQFRQAWDNIVAAKNGFAGADLTNQVKARAYKASADGMRNILNSDNPSVEALNREFSFWKDAARVIDDTNMRTSTQAKPLGVKLARAGAQAAGFVKGGTKGAFIAGEAMSGVESLITSPAWQTVSALAKSRLADALASGSTADVAEVLGQLTRASVATPRLAPGRGNSIGSSVGGGMTAPPPYRIPGDQQ